MNNELYPLLFHPVYKDYLWGGTRIPTLFHRDSPPGLCAESWEVSDRPEGMSVVRDGPLAGESLQSLVRRFPQAFLSPAQSARSGPDPRFPLLIKIIDAAQTLSVQVHPDNDSARFGGEAKTEMWYILDAQPDAVIYAGFLPGVTPSAFQRAIENRTVADLLRRIPAVAGEVVFVPGGRIHAIGQGCLMLEVQQSSNTTYRVYDWDRLDRDGRPRELHLEQALRVINWKDCHADARRPALFHQSDGNRWFDILRCEHFHALRLDMTGAERIPAAEPAVFRALFVVEGDVEVSAEGSREKLTMGTSCLIPASPEPCDLLPVSGVAQVIIVSPTPDDRLDGG